MLPVYVVITCFYVYRYAYLFLRDRLSTLKKSIGCLVVFSWYDVITYKKYKSHWCALLDAFFCNFVIFDVSQYSHRLDYIKDLRQAIYFNNQKIVAYHL